MADFSLKTSGTLVDSAGTSAGFSTTLDLPTIIGKSIGIVLGILGVLFLIIVVYAGFLYLTSNGEETNVKKAKKMLSQSIIGLILIVSAYAITGLVTASLKTISSEAVVPVESTSESETAAAAATAVPASSGEGVGGMETPY